MLIPYSQFGALRLRSILPGAEVEDLTGWEFEDRRWVGEAVGFSEWLRLEDEPDVLRSLSIDFPHFPAAEAGEVLRKIGLPLRAGMTADGIREILGEPSQTLRFADDRTTYEFLSAGPHPYNVSCTVLHDGGLSYLVVRVPSS